MWLGCALVLLAVWASGCATLNPGPRRENFAPFFIYSEDEKRGGVAFDALGPLFSYRKDDAEKDVAFRPFFHSQTQPDRYRLDYLYPLGGHEKTETRYHSYFFLVYSTSRDLTEEPTQKKERNFLLAFWGKTNEGESYGGLFPIYGNLKKRFGRDELDFALWPLYTHSREGEAHAYTLLWPFFSLYTGKREGFKVWPLAGYDHKENDYRKFFFLWPFFDFEKRNLYTDDPTNVEMVFPLYVNMSSQKQVYRSVLFPFFSYTYDEFYNYKEWDVPWPFIMWGKGDGRYMFRIFPFYNRYQFNEFYSGYILFPAYWYTGDEDENSRHRLNRYLLFSKDETRFWKKDLQEERRLRVWPFFYYRQEKEGGVFLYWPCIIPFDLEGIERNWSPLLTLYEYRSTPEGDRESKLLWGFYVHRKNPTRSLFELSFLFSYYSAPEVKYFSFVKGLLEYLSDGPKRAMRILYSPWPVRWESDTGKGKEDG